MLFEPEITPYSECPDCRRLLPITAERCPYCGEPIDLEASKRSSALYVRTTQAINAARAITNRDYVILLFLIYTIYMRWSGRNVFYDVPRAWMWAEVLFALIWIFPLVIVIRWFLLHGRCNTLDSEYVVARKDVRLSFRLWIAAHVFHVLLVFAYA